MVLDLQIELASGQADFPAKRHRVDEKSFQFLVLRAAAAGSSSLCFITTVNTQRACLHLSSSDKHEVLGI